MGISIGTPIMISTAAYGSGPAYINVTTVTASAVAMPRSARTMRAQSTTPIAEATAIERIAHGLNASQPGRPINDA